MNNQTSYTDQEERQSIFETAKDLEVDFFYSSKGHYASASVWDSLSLWIGTVIVVLSTASGFLASAGDDAVLRGVDLSPLVPVFSFLVAILSAIVTSTKAAERASIHRAVGVKFGTMRDKVKKFYNIECRKADLIELETKIDKWIDEKDKMNTESPHIPRWAYKRAIKERPRGNFVKDQPAWDNTAQ